MECVWMCGRFSLNPLYYLNYELARRRLWQRQRSLRRLRWRYNRKVDRPWKQIICNFILILLIHFFFFCYCFGVSIFWFARHIHTQPHTHTQTLSVRSLTMLIFIFLLFSFGSSLNRNQVIRDSKLIIINGKRKFTEMHSLMMVEQINSTECIDVDEFRSLLNVNHSIF